MNILHIIKKLIPKKLFKKLQPAYHFSFAWLAAFLYGFPSRKLIVIGVTGTTGKTTTTHLTAKMLENAGLPHRQTGFKVGYTSTALMKIGEKEWLNDKRMTMPGRFATQRMLSMMVREKCQYAIVETTSEGIEQFRHRFINYDILIFTSLYPEHIESHGSFENYKKAKGKLFAYLEKCKSKYVDQNKKVIKVKNEIKKIYSERIKKTIIANGDDEYAEYFLQFKAEEKYAYHIAHNTNHITNDEYQKIIAKNVAGHDRGVSFEVQDVKFDLRFMGEFQAYNAMGAVCVGLTQELSLEKISQAMKEIKGVPGRFERIDEGQDFTVIVEFAHEPGALAKFYNIINKMSHNRIIHVLGSAGGGRDVARRPVLGKLAGENDDIVIVANEDPYDDDPQIIIDQIAIGAEKAGKVLGEDLFKIQDRKEAIKKAVNMAKEGDVVIITGKGCEQIMCMADGKTIPSDDRGMAREALKSMTNNQ